MGLPHANFLMVFLFKYGKSLYDPHMQDRKERERAAGSLNVFSWGEGIKGVIIGGTFVHICMDQQQQASCISRNKDGFSPCGKVINSNDHILLQSSMVCVCRRCVDSIHIQIHRRRCAAQAPLSRRQQM